MGVRGVMFGGVVAVEVSSGDGTAVATTVSGSKNSFSFAIRRTNASDNVRGRGMVSGPDAELSVL